MLFGCCLRSWDLGEIKMMRYPEIHGAETNQCVLELSLNGKDLIRQSR
jgi:hypothetical protein